MPCAMTKVLITGFSPFGGNETNPSEKAVRALPDIENAMISKLYLPVVWSSAAQALEREISVFSAKESAIAAAIP